MIPDEEEEIYPGLNEILMLALPFFSTFTIGSQACVAKDGNVERIGASIRNSLAWAYLASIFLPLSISFLWHTLDLISFPPGVNEKEIQVWP